MPSKRSLVLGLIGLGVLVAIVLLALKVTESPAVEVDPAKLAAAQAAYQRRQAQEPPPSLPPVPVARAARSGPQVEREEVERDPRPTPAPIEPRRLKLSPSTPADVAQVAQIPGQEIKQRMDEANGFYDRADYESARESAMKVLQEQPDEVRMLRIVVSSSCIMGDHDVATEYFSKLGNERDRKQMARRCSRYGVELTP